MNSELLAYITLICTSGVLNLYLCLYVFFKRHNYSNIINLFSIIYCFASAFGLMSTSVAQVKVWTIIQYIGMPFSAPLGFLFIMHYLGIKITKGKCILFLIIPLISFIMVFTNDWHHYHYRVFEIDIFLGAPFVYQEVGFWYIIHGIYTFSCMLGALLLLVSRWKETAKVYRPQLLALMLGQFIPMVTAFVYLLGLTPSGIDPVPMVLWISSLLYLWSINSTRMFAIMPIAKDIIFNSINDGVIVLDESHRLIEFNRECKRMFPYLDKSMLGVDIKKVWSDLSSDPFPIELGEKAINQELKIANAIYQVRVSPLEHVQNSKGLLIIFTDITELKNLQSKLESLAYFDELTQLNLCKLRVSSKGSIFCIRQPSHFKTIERPFLFSSATCFSPHMHNKSKISPKVSPYLLKLYSTFGGT